jgi:hypothetical protein
MVVMTICCRFVAGFFTDHPFIEPPTVSSHRAERQFSNSQATNTSSLSTKRSFEWSEPYS